jgi:hypothetical protein
MERSVHSALPLSESTLEGSFDEFQEVLWGDVAPLLEKTNSSLHERLDQVAREKDSPKLYLASYRFGDDIVEEGTFKAPCGHLHSEKEAGMCSCDRIWESLSYPIPLSIVLDGSTEVFETTIFIYSKKKEEQVVPLRILGQGGVFGDFESLDSFNYEGQLPPPAWSVSAGIRSAYLQMRTGNEQFWEELWGQLDQSGAEDLPLSLDDLEEGSDHELISFILEYHPDLNDWSSTLLIIPNDWFVGSTIEERHLQHLLYERAWVKSRPQRYDLSRTSRHFESVKKHSKYTPFLRHLLFATRGDLPIFRPATLEEGCSTGPSIGPLFEVQEFLDSVTDGVSQRYQRFYPAILQPAYLDQQDTVGYFSFRFPALKNPIPDVKNFSAEYALPTAEFFSPTRYRKKQERMDHFKIEDLAVFHSGDKSGRVLKNKDVIGEEYINEFVPPEKEGKSLQLRDGLFLSPSIRIARG